MLQVSYEVELHTSYMVTVGVLSVGQGTHFVLAGLEAALSSPKKSGVPSLTKQRLFVFIKENN